MARVLEFRIEEEKELYFLCTETKALTSYAVTVNSRSSYDARYLSLYVIVRKIARANSRRRKSTYCGLCFTNCLFHEI